MNDAHLHRQVSPLTLTLARPTTKIAPMSDRNDTDLTDATRGMPSAAVPFVLRPSKW